MDDKKIFIAGASGAVGLQLIKLLEKRNQKAIAHLRPKAKRTNPFSKEQELCEIELSDPSALEAALSNCQVAIQLIGTIKKRFSSGDTYQSSDIDTTRFLVNAAKNTQIKHFILLSSVGAGNPIGAYLKAKAEAESLLLQSRLPYSIIRPSAFEGDRHKTPPGSKAFFKICDQVGLKNFSSKYKTIQLEELVEIIFRLANLSKAQDKVYEGESLWDVLEN